MLLERFTRPTRTLCPLILGLLETYHNIIKCSRLASGLYLVYRLLTVILTSFLLYRLPTLLCFYKYAYDRLSDVVVDPTFLGPQSFK